MMYCMFISSSIDKIRKLLTLFPCASGWLLLYLPHVPSLSLHLPSPHIFRSCVIRIMEMSFRALSSWKCSSISLMCTFESTTKKFFFPCPSTWPMPARSMPVTVSSSPIKPASELPLLSKNNMGFSQIQQTSPVVITQPYPAYLHVILGDKFCLHHT